VITKDQVMPLLIEACPSYCIAAKKSEDADLLYVEMGNFARHLLQLHQQRRIEEFSAIARIIERLHVEGDSYVRELATIGLLEGIQNVWSNNNVEPELFIHYLSPISMKWWKSLNDFWSGKSTYVGEGL